MKKIRLTYTLADGQTCQLDGLWPSTWAAVDTAAALGAVHACAKVRAS